MLSYEKFKEKLKEKIVTELKLNKSEYIFYDKAAVTEEQMKLICERMKKDTLEHDALVVGDIKADETNWCVFDVSELYSAFLEHGWKPVLQAVYGNATIIRNVHIMADYSKIHGSIMLKPVNINTMGEDELNHIVHKTVADIVLIPCVYMGQNEQGAILTANITKEMMEGWGKNQEEIYFQALMNSLKKSPPRIYFDPKELAVKSAGKFMEPGSSVMTIKPGQAPIITTTTRLNGAVAVFYPGVLDKIAQMFGDNFYIAFANTDHAFIHPQEGTNPMQIRMGLERAAKATGEKYVLSRKIFFYSANNKSLSVMDESIGL